VQTAKGTLEFSARYREDHGIGAGLGLPALLTGAGIERRQTICRPEVDHPIQQDRRGDWRIATRERWAGTGKHLTGKFRLAKRGLLSSPEAGMPEQCAIAG
jgi:hypothetical protein